VGWPQDDLVPEEEYQAIREAIAAKDAEEEMAERAGQIADAVPKISKEVEPGSVLGNVMEVA